MEQLSEQDKLNQVLIKAFAHNSEIAIPLLLRAGADPNVLVSQIGGESETLLHFLIHQQQHREKKDVTKAIKLLLEDERTDPNIRNGNEITALFHAASDNNIEGVKLLLADKRTDPNIGCWRSSPLHTAAEHGYAEIVKLLLANERTDPNIPDHDKVTPLDAARKQYKMTESDLAKAEGRGDKGTYSYLSTRKKGLTEVISALENIAQSKWQRRTEPDSNQGVNVVR